MNVPKPQYETVVETWELIPLAIAMGIHGLVVALQLGVAVFLILSGGLALRSFARSVWLRRLGLSVEGKPISKIDAGLRIGCGGLLLLPLSVGAPTVVSLLACVVATTVLVRSERSLAMGSNSQGRVARRLAIGATAAVALFMVWEREDGLALGVALATNMQEWRVQELEWQYANDVDAPKVGDLAPDFELQDPEGETSVRLSDFRDKRPVVLVFGSYT